MPAWGVLLGNADTSPLVPETLRASCALAPSSQFATGEG